jgi:hypothetical protein
MNYNLFFYICIVIVAAITNKDIRGNTINRLDLAATISGQFNFMEEIWKDIPGYEGVYQVSNLGNVKAVNYRNTKKHRYLKPSLNSSGYEQVQLWVNGQKKALGVHLLVAISFLGHTPNKLKGLVVDHINNDRIDNKLSNLQLISHRHNLSKDQKNKTSKYTGVSWNKSKLKWVAQIHFNGKTKSLGRFKSEEEAYQAYQNKLNEIQL